MLVEAARRLDPPRLRRVLGHLRLVADPDGADRHSERLHGRRGLWLAPTWEGMVAVDGLLDPEAGEMLVAALEPLARPSSAEDERSAGQRRADALTELARRTLESGRLPKTQLTVTVDLDSLLGRSGPLGGEGGWAGPLDPEACRRLACDGALNRVLVTRHPTSHPGPTHHPNPNPSAGPGGHTSGPTNDPGGAGGLAARLRAAAALLPPVLGGAPTQPLEVGRGPATSSTPPSAPPWPCATAAVFPGCQRPQAWCEAHHLRHWLHGGPTDLANLALLCRTHHRTVHEGGWRLQRHPDGRLTATPPHRRPRAA